MFHEQDCGAEKLQFFQKQDQFDYFVGGAVAGRGKNRVDTGQRAGESRIVRV